MNFKKSIIEYIYIYNLIYIITKTVTVISYTSWNSHLDYVIIYFKSYSS